MTIYLSDILSNMDWNKIRTTLTNLGKIVWNALINLFVLVLYYLPIIRTRLVEWTSFYVPIFDHNTPIQINESHNVFITACSAGKPGHKLVNIFYKYYAPYSIN